jgi:hypothetical protein
MIIWEITRRVGEEPTWLLSFGPFFLLLLFKIFTLN